MPERLKNADKAVGAKQALRALKTGKARLVYLAADADPKVTEPLALLCAETGVESVSLPSMQALGRACGISVGSAAVALLG